MTSKARDEAEEVGRSDPSSGGDVGSRISLVVSLYKTKTEAARSAAITPEMLNRYIRGEHKLPFDKAAGLCQPVGVSLNWLAWGAGTMLITERPSAQLPPTISTFDEALLSNLVQGLEAFLEREDLRLEPKPKARLTVLLYKLLLDRRRRALEAGDVPPELIEPDHPYDIGADALFSDIVRIVE